MNQQNKASICDSQGALEVVDIRLFRGEATWAPWQPTLPLQSPFSMLHQTQNMAVLPCHIKINLSKEV